MTPSQKAALAELATKTIEQIQVETAQTWAYRAWAARYLAASASGDARDNLLHDAASYTDEAIEHAALSGDDDILAAVRRIVSE